MVITFYFSRGPIHFVLSTSMDEYQLTPLSSHKPLNETRFTFSVHSTPKVSYSCVSVSLPGVNLRVVDAPFPNTTEFYPGIRADFSDLALEFLIDQNMENYLEMWKWIEAMAFPEDIVQRRQWLEKAPTNVGLNLIAKAMVDCTLFVYTTQYNPLLEIRFFDCFPTGLYPVAFTSRSFESQELTCTVTIRYRSFKFEKTAIRV